MKTVSRYWMRGSAMTHRGSVRPHNEDAFLLGGVHAGSDLDMSEPISTMIEGKSWIVAVADGIGGNQAGERASREVVSLLANRENYTPSIVSSILYYAHSRLFKIGASDPAKAGLGTTVAGIAYGAEGLFAFSVGDSRVYQRQDQFLAQVTRDDSIGAVMAAAGDIAQNEFERRSLRALTQCVGGRFPDRTIKPNIHALDIRISSRLLICTDGLSEAMSHEALEQTFAQPANPIDTAKRLLDLALTCPARDNVTLAVIDVTPE